MPYVKDRHYKNLCKRHGVSEAQIKDGVDTISKGLDKIVEPDVLVAICELLLYGDIEIERGD